MGLTDLTVTELSAKLTKGETTSLEIAHQIIEGTHAAAALNAYVNFDADALLSQARLADQMIDKGVRLPLLGIPIGLKDNIDAVGFLAETELQHCKVYIQRKTPLWCINCALLVH